MPKQTKILEEAQDLKVYDWKGLSMEEAMHVVQGVDDWWAYRDYEKRELAFKAGVAWARENPI